MKNMKRFFCFFLCFCLCFSWFGPPIEAHAAGGVVAFLGILVAFMAAHGFGLAASGVADSLRNGLEGWAKEYVAYANESGWAEWTFAEWVQQIMSDVVINNAGYFALGSVAVKYLNDFMNWLTGNVLSDGGSVGLESFTVYHCPIFRYSSDPNLILDTSVVSVDSSGNIVSIMVNSYIDTFFTGHSDTLHYNLHNYFGCYRTDSGYYFSASPSRGSINKVATYDTNMSGLRFTIAVDNKFPYETAYRPVYLILLNSKNEVVFSYCNNFYIPNSASYTFCEGTVSYDSENAPDLIDSESNDFGAMVLNTGDVVANDPSNMDDFSSSIMGAVVSGEFSSTREVVSSDIVDDPLVTDPPVESDGTLEGNVAGILQWIKAILEAIRALPVGIANLILDGIKSIFVPDPDEINAQFMELLEEINDKYLFDFDLDSLFGSSKEPDDITAVYSLGDHEWNLTFVSWYYLKKAVEFFRPYIRGFIVLMLIFYNLRQFMAIFGLGGVMNGDSADRRVEDLAV